jgi:hypothetical protein
MACFVFAQELPVLLGHAPSVPAALAGSLGCTALIALGGRVSRRFRAGHKESESLGTPAGTPRVTAELGDEIP